MGWNSGDFSGSLSALIDSNEGPSRAVPWRLLEAEKLRSTKMVWIDHLGPFVYLGTWIIGVFIFLFFFFFEGFPKLCCVLLSFAVLGFTCSRFSGKITDGVQKRFRAKGQ